MHIVPNVAPATPLQIVFHNDFVFWSVDGFLLQETKPLIQELSIKTTIISRYAFTAVHCAMLNRHSAASEGVFHFQIPAEAYVSNFTM